MTTTSARILTLCVISGILLSMTTRAREAELAVVVDDLLRRVAAYRAVQSPGTRTSRTPMIPASLRKTLNDTALAAIRDAH